MIRLGFSKKEATDFLIEYSSLLKEPNTIKGECD